MSSLLRASAIIGLALLDLLGAYFALETARLGSMAMAVAGALSFVALFVAYTLSLRLGDVITITFGWIAVLEVGVIALAVARGARYPLSVWLAITAVTLGTGWLIVKGEAA